MKQYKSLLFQCYKSFSFYEKTLVGFISFGLLLLLFQGIIYPPNNWDSLTYHMSRIMYWLSNESVAHFPSHILRHLYQPPFAEYFILHLNLLNGNDYLSNSVQWLFLVFSIISIWSLLDYFKVSRFYKLLVAFLILTIPAVELQSSTTKNDIVCGFFIITAIYFSCKSYYESELKNFVFLGLTVGLGLLTKGTAYIFLTPILLLLALFILFKIIKTKQIKPLLNGCITLLIVFLINLGHYSRNFKINRNVLNIDETEAKAYSNEKMNGTLFLSNFLKNAGLHLGYPIQAEADSLIKGIHKKISIPVNNPETNYYGIPYEGAIKINTNEDCAPNVIHFFLILLSFFALGFNRFKNLKENKKQLLLGLIIIAQLVLFVGYLKWQPWHTRLHIPIFMLSVVLITVAANQSKWFKYIVLASIPLMMFSFYFYFVYNNTRPISTNREYTKNIHLLDNRFKKYFSNQPHLYGEYSEVLGAIYSNNSTKIGLMLSDWEYPLLYNFYYYPIKIVAVNVNNCTSGIPQNTENIDAIIANNQKTDFIIFQGRKYINQNPNHSYIWFYK
ncbi:glycosyltransferase family 39 protein [Flavobacterium sp.]|uniref:glycosyltransferase family 39 protein n=1 Tax=Flavobacterium sp. TaxID=239 RepID=UPI00286A7F03|nr:glycosyltransferase family 39 protein [Flavobacterium sp.]